MTLAQLREVVTRLGGNVVVGYYDAGMTVIVNLPGRVSRTYSRDAGDVPSALDLAVEYVSDVTVETREPWNGEWAPSAPDGF